MAEDRVNTVTHCRYCRTELSYDKTRGCKVCFTCHPPSKTTIAPPEKKKYLDVKMTEERVREIFRDELMGCKFDEEQIRDIVRDELENWHIQKPSVTEREIQEIKSQAVEDLCPIVQTQSDVSDVNWRQQAKELGIPLFQRKKADVLKDIEAKKAG